MKNLWSLVSFLVFLPAFTVAVIEINNIELYKPCIVDSTACPDDHACIQYFCYPKVASEADPLKSCKKNSHCDGWKPDKTEKCFKEGQNGVCVAAEDYEMCEAHEECEGRGGKCCGDYCCNEEYFDALQTQECTEGDEACEVRYEISALVKECIERRSPQPVKLLFLSKWVFLAGKSAG